MDPNHYTVFGSDNRRSTSGTFEGGRMTAVFADLDVDLREAETRGYPAVLELRALFAEVDLTVPEDWEVDVRLSTPLGEFNDRRRVRSGNGSSTDGPDLVLTGFGMFAEVTLRD